jgi:hypothetical protein
MIAVEQMSGHEAGDPGADDGDPHGSPKSCSSLLAFIV